MTLGADEFIRRFLLHVLPDGFHRIRDYGYLANGQRATKLAYCRRLLAIPEPVPPAPAADYWERYQRSPAAHSTSVRGAAAVRSKSRHSPCEHFRRCGFVEHFMIPMRNPSEPSVLDWRQLSTPSLRYRFQRPATANRSSEPRRSPTRLIDIRPMAATNIPIAAHWSLDSNRHRHCASTTGRAQSP